MTNAQTTTYQIQSAHDYWATLENINAKLAETISMASSDFLETCNLLKNCNVKTDQLKEQISAAVRELQHIDFLRQKLGHARDLHIELLPGQEPKMIGIDDEKKYASHALIFKINYYQLLAAHEDYTKVVSSVLGTIRKIKEHNVLLISFNAPVFSNRFQIDDNFRDLNESLNQLMQKYYCNPDFDWSWVTSQISTRYTMESERVVLQWCLKNTDGVPDEDFIYHYKTSNLDASIELF